MATVLSTQARSRLFPFNTDSGTFRILIMLSTGLEQKTGNDC